MLHSKKYGQVKKKLKAKTVRKPILDLPGLKSVQILKIFVDGEKGVVKKEN